MIAMVVAGCFLTKYRLTRAFPSFIRPTTTWISWNNFWDAPALRRGLNRSPRRSLLAEAMPDITLAVSPERKQAARIRLQSQGVDFNRTVVGVNPGAFYGSAKRWLSERYATVLDRLIDERQASVVIFGSPNEVAIAEAIQSGMRSRPVILSGRTELSELIAMIACCDLFLTNDSGPMHLAAALRVPTLAIFGSTDEIATGPMSPAAVVLNKRVECSPCLLRECPIDHRCMTRITAEEVVQQAFRMIDASRSSSRTLQGKKANREDAKNAKEESAKENADRLACSWPQ